MDKIQAVSPVKEIQRMRDLLRMEYEYERNEFTQESVRTGILKKVRQGLCWSPVRIGRSYYNSLNQFVVEIYRPADEEDIEHQFEAGTPVCFFAMEEWDKPRYFRFSATVSYVQDDLMVVQVPDANAVASLQLAEEVGVQIAFDETSYQLMFEALGDVAAAEDNRTAYLRDLFYTSRKAEKFSFSPIRFPWLNPAQEKAVNEVLCCKDVAIVHGPPGTGKTTTLVEAIYETLRRESQVLVCAQSNMAVDWISEQLVDRGIQVMRIGNPARVNDKMLSFTYERRFENHPDYPALWGIRRTIRQLYNQKKTASDRERLSRKIGALKEKADELEFRIRYQLFNETRVIACTLTGSANKTLSGMKFSTLFIDEAAQAMEPACWIAIRKASRVIFAGDHKQLPPTIKCYEAAKKGLADTLMEKIALRKPEVVTLLTTQYRMNERIMRFSSDWFYGGKVVSAPEVKYRSILDYDTPMEWIDTADAVEERKYTGKLNKEEARLTIDKLKEYISKIGKERLLDERIDFGIITPYRAQATLLRQLLRKEKTLKPFRNALTVNTVDGFQGQERDVVFISLVRANEKGEIGFLTDLRRMNVAITRARMKLFIIGNAETLSHHPFYKKLYHYITDLVFNE